MSDQDMQFADPDWRPTSPLAGNSSAQGKQASASPTPNAPYTPRPINDAWREQAPVEIPAEPRQGGASYTGYAGSMPAQQQQPYQYQGMPMRYRRRRRGPWLWIILVILLFSLLGGGFGSMASIGQKDLVEDHTFQVTGI